jgi:hypothetical protein
LTRAECARVRAEATDRLHRIVCEELTRAECARLDELLIVGEGASVCELERWRKGVSVPSGKNLERALRPAPRGHVRQPAAGGRPRGRA